MVITKLMKVTICKPKTIKYRLLKTLMSLIQSVKAVLQINSVSTTTTITAMV